MDTPDTNTHTGVIWDVRGPARNGLRWIGYCMINTLACDTWKRKLTEAESDMYETFTGYKGRRDGVLTAPKHIDGVPLPTIVAGEKLVTFDAAGPVNAQALLTLKPETWLVTGAVDGYFDYLRMELRRRRSNQAIHILGSDFFIKLSNALPSPGAHPSIHQDAQPELASRYFYNDAIERSKRKPKFMALDMVVTPVNIDNTHWTLLVLFPKKRNILFMDSLSNSSDSWGTVKPYIDAFLKTMDEGHNWDVLKYPLINQPNGYDCGVFTCAYGAYVIHGRERELFVGAPGVNDFNALAYRRHIFITILSYGTVYKQLQNITEGILYPNDTRTYSDVVTEKDDDGSEVEIVEPAIELSSDSESSMIDLVSSDEERRS